MPQPSHTRAILSGLIVLMAAVVGGLVGDRLTLNFALRSFPPSAALALAAAMAGLFSGGLCAMLAILIVVRSGGTHPHP